MRHRKCIFFGNLDAKVGLDCIKAIIEQFGRGYNVRVIPSEEKGVPVYGFADMDECDADKLLQHVTKYNMYYLDRKISIKESNGKISPRSHAIKEHFCCKIMAKRKERLERKLSKEHSNTNHSPME